MKNLLFSHSYPTKCCYIGLPGSIWTSISMVPVVAAHPLAFVPRKTRCQQRKSSTTSSLALQSIDIHILNLTPTHLICLGCSPYSTLNNSVGGTVYSQIQLRF